MTSSRARAMCTSESSWYRWFWYSFSFSLCSTCWPSTFRNYCSDQPNRSSPRMFESISAFCATGSKYLCSYKVTTLRSAMVSYLNNDFGHWLTICTLPGLTYGSFGLVSMIAFAKVRLSIISFPRITFVFSQFLYVYCKLFLMIFKQN